MPRNFLTPVQARHAIYLDFEGYEKQAPALLGYLVGTPSAPSISSVVHVVLDRTYEAAAIASHLRVDNLEDVVAGLLDVALADGRVLVAFSMREREAIELYVNEATATGVASVYVNALKFGKRWVRQCHADWTFPTARPGSPTRFRRDIGHTLSHFLAHIAYRVPQGAGVGHTTKRLTDVADGLKARGTYERLTGVQKRKWTNLLSHNAHDVLGLRELCVRAADELALSSSSAPRPLGT